MIKHTKCFLLILVLLFSAAVFTIVINSDLHNVENIKRTLAGLGKATPIIFILLCSVRSFMLLPCGAFSAIGGALFGPVKGTVLTLTGFTLNALIIYYMANYFGRDWVKRLLKDKADYIDNYVNKNSFSSCFYLRVIPLLPFDAVSCIAGILKAKLLYYLGATALGSIPGVFIYTYFGDALTTFSLKRILIPGLLILFMSLVPLLYKLIKHRRFVKRILSKDNKTTS